MLSQTLDTPNISESDNSVFELITNNEKGFKIIYKSGKSGFEQVKLPEGDFVKLKLPFHSFSTETGKPQLPVWTHLVDYDRAKDAIIKISEIVSHRHHFGTKEFSGQIFPSQPGRTKTEKQQQNRALEIDHEIYNSKELFFFDTVRIEKTGVLRGQSIGIIQINPVIYNPSENYFDLITSMVIDVEYTSSYDKSESKNKGWYSRYFDDLLSKGLITYPEEDVIPDFTLQPTGMIIVTDTSMKEFIRPLVEWKTRKGFNVKEIIIGENGIERTYTDIKDTLSIIYNNSTSEDPAPAYLLLAGDLNYIPRSGGTSQLSDLYYAEFDGNGDYLPDMFVGRLPAKDSTEMKSIVRKIIQYESFEFGDSIKHFEKAVATTGLDGGNISHMDGQVNYGRTYFDQNPNPTESHIFIHELNDSIRNVRFDSLKALLNDGIGFINYTGHGSVSSWMSTGIDYNFIQAMTNQSRYPFVISNACLTGKYNEPNCFGSSMVRADAKGAIAFIGCSNNSYWDPDYYFAVGVGSISSNPEYDKTGPGFYDRLFHLNNEKPSEWYTTFGQIMVSGNMSVSLSSSSRVKYYWETYNLLGDPSLSPIIGAPDDINALIPDSLPHTLNSLNISTDPFVYVAISHFDTLWDASHSTESGTVSLSIPAGQKDSCLIVISGQNKIPLIKTLYFNESDTAWMNIDDVTADDPLGNNNDLADYSEEISLNIDLQNAGNSIANDVYLLLDSNSEYIIINSDSVFIDTFDPLSEQTLTDLFNITVADSIPDLAIVNLIIELHYEGNIITYYPDISLHAPDIEILNCITEDDISGNGNGLSEAGERVNVVFRIANNGSSSCSGTLYLSNISSYLEFDNLTLNTGIIEAGQIIEISEYADIDALAPEAEELFFDADLNCSPYFTDKTLSIIASKSVEDFELENFTTFPWSNTADHPWTISSSDAYSNLYSARSGAIDHYTKSVLTMTLNMMEDDTISFMYKVSSELKYDFFTFQVDTAHVDTVVVHKSGETDWTLVKHPLKKGVHLLQWIYSKDATVYGGSDCAWIDLVRFPVQSFIQNAIDLSEISSPDNGGEYQNETISVELCNLGRDTLNTYTLAYIVNDANPVYETFGEEFIPGDSITVSFSEQVNMAEAGNYDIKVYVTSPDNFFIEDTLQLLIISVGIGDIIINDDSFTVAPNPIIDNIRIISNGEFFDNLLELYNNNGMLLFNKHINYISAGEEITLATPDAGTGIYTLLIRNNKGNFVYRLLKL